MPILIDTSEMKVQEQEGGWAMTTLADEAAIGAPAIVARRWSFQPGARTRTMVHGDVEQLLYVIRGRGVAFVDDQELALEPESVLWLEPGDQYALQAGPERLEILQGFPLKE